MEDQLVLSKNYLSMVDDAIEIVVCHRPMLYESKFLFPIT